MTTPTLIQAEELAAALDDPRLRVFDCRFDLARPAYGRAAYGDEHLPGAVHADLNLDLSRPVTPGSGRHPLPSPEEFAARLRGWGVDGDSRVVAYDDGNGAYAARLWWMLRWLGHDGVRVLDGGMRRWLQLGLPLSVRLSDCDRLPLPLPLGVWLREGEAVGDRLRDPVGVGDGVALGDRVSCPDWLGVAVAEGVPLPERLPVGRVGEAAPGPLAHRQLPLPPPTAPDTNSLASHP